MIANRSFEYYEREVDPPERPSDAPDIRAMCWEALGNCRFSIGTLFPFSKFHGNYAHLSGRTGTGLRNLGFCGEGLAVHEGQVFRFSCYARNTLPLKKYNLFSGKSGPGLVKVQPDPYRCGKLQLKAYSVTILACSLT